MRRTLLTTFALTAALTLPAARARAQAEEGDWTITPARRHGSVIGDSVQLTLMRSPNGMSSFPVALSRLRGLAADALAGAPATARFQMASDAGVVSFTGHVGGGTGSGTFTFASRPAFSSALRQRGVSDEISEHDLFRLAIVGTSTASVDALLTALRRHDDEIPSAPQLVRFATHGVTERVVADLGEAGLHGLSAEQIIRLVNHDVDGRYVREWKAAGYGDLDTESLFRLRNHEVTPEWARAANDRAGARLGVERLVRLRRGR
jgi:hypothetical protein